MTGAGLAVAACPGSVSVSPSTPIADAVGAREIVEPEIMIGESSVVDVWVPSTPDGLLSDESSLEDGCGPKAPAMIAPRPEDGLELGREPAELESSMTGTDPSLSEGCSALEVC